MKKVADIWYCSFNEVVNCCGIKEVTVKMGCLRGSSYWQTIPDPDDRRRRLIRYDTLAVKYRRMVESALCGGLTPDVWFSEARRKVLSERSLPELLEIALQTDWRRYVGLYKITDRNERSTEKRVRSLAMAAAVIETLGNYIQDHDIDPRSYVPYREALAWLGDHWVYYSAYKDVPTNEVRLKEKVNQRFVDRLPIQEVVKLPRQGNRSREQFANDPELMAWIAMARSQGTNDPNAYIIRKISEVCRIVGREVPSNSWFSQVLASPKMKQLTANGRFGAGTKYAGRYTHSITMARAMYAGDCWMMDATRVNMVEHQTQEKGKQAFLFVIAIRDAYSGDIVGCHFDTKEDRWGYTNALKMAVKVTGYLPHTLVYDRFPGHISDEMQSILGSMEAKGVQLVCTHKATGKALLERWFDTLQTVFFSQSRYYYGQGIMSTRPYAHRSPDYLVKLRKEARNEGWDFDKAWQEAWRRIEEYRQTPVSYYSRKHAKLDLSPSTLHEQSEKPNVIRVEVWEQASLFWMTKILDIRRNRIEQEVHGVRYEYLIYDTQIMYRYSRVAVRYEESDPSKVMLFAVGADDRVSDFFIAELTHAKPIPMYGPDADPGRLAGRQAKIDKFEQQKRADLEELTSGATVDPEYLLTLGGRVSKDEYESVATAVIYEQMGVSIQADAQTPAKQKRTKPAPPILPDADEVFDPKDFVNQSFFNNNP
ncbi:transposase [Fibrisoma montanum]|uniref:Transposase n=1 Tax=Fibrisoma montanum TaxID=2305895 RepID=A0A418M610_9BACT|nr:DDE-type integrase/transposase/recombinase [Fibrisoma montanum]RIV21350.1 transposase [Fibrisoma montanum]